MMHITKSQGMQHISPITTLSHPMFCCLPSSPLHIANAIAVSSSKNDPRAGRVASLFPALEMVLTCRFVPFIQINASSKVGECCPTTYKDGLINGLAREQVESERVRDGISSCSFCAEGIFFVRECVDD